MVARQLKGSPEHPGQSVRQVRLVDGGHPLGDLAEAGESAEPVSGGVQQGRQRHAGRDDRAMSVAPGDHCWKDVRIASVLHDAVFMHPELTRSGALEQGGQRGSPDAPVAIGCRETRYRCDGTQRQQPLFWQGAADHEDASRGDVVGRPGRQEALQHHDGCRAVAVRTVGDPLLVQDTRPSG